MKKILSVFLTVMSILCISSAFSGCVNTITLFSAGTYETYEIYNAPFVKANFIIQPITEKEFENANGINVIKNKSTKKENNIYYGIELFLYDDSQEEYVQATIIKLYHPDGWHSNTYSGEMKYCFDKIDYQVSFTFSYSEHHVVISYVAEDNNVCYLYFNFIN